MRVLHAGAGDGRPRPARPHPEPTETEIREELSGQHLPLHRLRPDHRGRPAGRPATGRGDGTDDATSTIGAARAHRPASATRRRARRDRQGAGHVRLLVRPPDRRGGLWGDAALAAPVRPHRLDRRRRRGGSPASRRCITADDVPGKPTYGLIASRPAGVRPGRRALRRRAGRRGGRRPPRDVPAGALAAIVVEYEVLEPLLDPEAAIAGSVPPIHPDGNVLRHQRIVHGDPDATGDVVVEGTYEIGMQDQAFLGLEAALADPRPDGTRRRAAHRHAVAARGPQADRRLPRPARGAGAPRARRRRRRVRRPRGHQPAGAHLPAGAALGRPVRMQYSRAESFLGHVHRHPATIWMRHHATADGEIVKIEARFVLDGGAYASTSSAVLLNAITHTQGPYRCPNAVVDGYAVRTNHLPCGAMRGFGVVQACFAHESQMDQLAEACGLDPVEVRLRNAMATGDRLITGQVVESVAPVARCIRETAALPLPVADRGRRPSIRCACPGGAGLTADVGTSAGRRLGRGDEEPDVLRGLRRLLDGPLPARRRRGHAQVRHAPRSARASSRSPSRSPARCSASTTSCSTRSTRRSARPARRRRRARRG